MSQECQLATKASKLTLIFCTYLITNKQQTKYHTSQKTTPQAPQRVWKQMLSDSKGAEKWSVKLVFTMACEGWLSSLASPLHHLDPVRPFYHLPQPLFMTSVEQQWTHQGTEREESQPLWWNHLNKDTHDPPLEISRLKESKAGNKKNKSHVSLCLNSIEIPSLS